MTELGKDNKYIDIEKTIRESDSELLTRIPPYAIKWIQSIVKQDEINHILNKYSDYSGKEFLDKIIKEFNVTIEVEGKENLPENDKLFCGEPPIWHIGRIDTDLYRVRKIRPSESHCQ
jgi:hypothetical protein